MPFSCGGEEGNAESSKGTDLDSEPYDVVRLLVIGMGIALEAAANEAEVWLITPCGGGDEDKDSDASERAAAVVCSVAGLGR
jgi:hypothetical protein